MYIYIYILVHTYAYTYVYTYIHTYIHTYVCLQIIFVEDNVWIRTNPTFSGRVTIASGRLATATDQTNVTIVDDIKYEVQL
jgi:hypothetical protein